MNRPNISIVISDSKILMYIKSEDSGSHDIAIPNDRHLKRKAGAERFTVESMHHRFRGHDTNRDMQD